MASTINASSSGSGGLISTGDASGVLQLQNNGTVAVTLSTTGNMGLKVTPSAWGPTYYTALQFGPQGVLTNEIGRAHV